MQGKTLPIVPVIKTVYFRKEYCEVVRHISYIQVKEKSFTRPVQDIRLFVLLPSE